MKNSHLRWAALIVANVLICCVLSFYRSSGAAPRQASQPFGNSVQQRGQMIRELKEIKALLKEQNALLRAGGNKSSDGNQRPTR